MLFSQATNHRLRPMGPPSLTESHSLTMIPGFMIPSSQHIHTTDYHTSRLVATIHYNTGHVSNYIYTDTLCSSALKSKSYPCYCLFSTIYFYIY